MKSTLFAIAILLAFSSSSAEFIALSTGEHAKKVRIEAKVESNGETLVKFDTSECVGLLDPPVSTSSLISRAYIDGKYIDDFEEIRGTARTLLRDMWNQFMVVVLDNSDKSVGPRVALCHGLEDVIYSNAPATRGENYDHEGVDAGIDPELRRCQIQRGDERGLSYYRRRGVYHAASLMIQLSQKTMENDRLKKRLMELGENPDSFLLPFSSSRPNTCLHPPSPSSSSSPSLFSRHIESHSRRGESLTLTCVDFRHLHILSEWNIHLASLQFENIVVLAADAGTEQQLIDIGANGGCGFPSVSSRPLLSFMGVLEALKLFRSVFFVETDQFLAHHLFPSLAAPEAVVARFLGVGKERKRLLKGEDVERNGMNEEDLLAMSSVHFRKIMRGNLASNNNGAIPTDWVDRVLNAHNVDLLVIGEDHGEEEEEEENNNSASSLSPIRAAGGVILLARSTPATIELFSQVIQLTKQRSEKDKTKKIDAVQVFSEILTAEGDSNLSTLRWGLLSRKLFPRSNEWGKGKPILSLDCSQIADLEDRLGKLFQLFHSSPGPTGFGNSLSTPSPLDYDHDEKIVDRILANNNALLKPNLKRKSIDLGMPVYVISIARNPMRRESIVRHLHEMGVDAQIFRGWDGYGLSKEETQLLYDHEEHVLNYPMSEGLNRGNIGTCISHYRLWQQLLETGVEKALILEDDARLHPQIEKLKEAMDLLPSDWDLVHLSHRPFDGTPNYHPHQVLATNKNGLQLVKYPKLVYFLLGYVIKASTIDAVLSRVYPLYEVVDVFVDPGFYQFRTRAGDSWDGLNRYGLMPSETDVFVYRDGATGTTVFGDSG